MTCHEAYRILRISETATEQEIKTAYRSRARSTHPDAGGTAAEFILVQAAYEVLCGLRGERAEASEIPIPDELRRVIDQIVRDFRRQIDATQAAIDGVMCEFYDASASFIAQASRNDLAHFNDTFRANWNDTVRQLLAATNEGVARIVGKYEHWFDKTMEQDFVKLHNQAERTRFRNFVRSPWFGLLCLVPVAVAGGSFATVGAKSAMILGLGSTVLSVIPALLLHLPRRHLPELKQSFALTLFNLDSTEVISEKSEALRRAQQGVVFAGVAGMGLARGLGRSLGPAAAIGLLVLGAAEVINRVVNPTDKLRTALMSDLDHFMNAAVPEILRIVMEGQQQALNGLTVQVEQNFRQRVHTMARLIAAP